MTSEQNQVWFFTSSGFFQKVTEKSRWDTKFFKKSLKNVAEISKVYFLFVANFYIFYKKSRKKSLRFQKSTFCHWFPKKFFRNFPEFRQPTTPLSRMVLVEWLSPLLIASQVQLSKKSLPTTDRPTKQLNKQQHSLRDGSTRSKRCRFVTLALGCSRFAMEKTEGCICTITVVAKPVEFTH